MAESDNRLGACFESLKFTTEERVRIAESARTNGIAAQILERHVFGLKPYKEVFQKKEKISGFRPGTPAYDKQALPIIVRRLRETADGNFKFFWELYRGAAITFVIAELPSLNSLLKETPAPTNNKDPLELFRTVCINAFDFGVTADDVRKLYEAWWTPRLEKIEELLPLCSVQDEQRSQKRQAAKLANELKELKATIQALRSEIPNQIETILKSADLFSQERKKIEELEATLIRKSDKEAEFTANASSKAEANFKVLEDRISRLTDRIKPLEQFSKDALTSKELKAEIKKLSDETRASIAKASETSLTAAKSLREETESNITSLEARLTAAAKEASKKRESFIAPPQSSLVAAKYKSPLTLIPATGTAYKVSNELEFVSSWTTHLSRTRNVHISFEQALAYHCAFLSSRVSICELEIARSWIECLGWNQFTLHMAASPTWTSEEDWEAGAKHLFETDQSNSQPKILVIHNFDAGITDCYLVPSLVLWTVQQQQRGLRKIFLIASQQTQSLTASLLEHALHIPSGDYISDRELSLNPGIKGLDPGRKDLPVGADPKLATQWLTPPKAIDYDFSTIQKSLNITISPQVRSNVEFCASLSAKYFSDSAALGIAMYHQALPWVRARYGESSYSELGAFLKQLEIGY